MAGKPVVKEVENLLVYTDSVIAHETVFNPTKHYLGTLCKHNHEFQNTGFSARYRSMEGCVRCAVDSGVVKRQEATKIKALLIVGIPDGSLRCPRCSQIKTTENFYKNSGSKTGFASYCKPCTAVMSKEYQEKYPERIKRSNAKARSLRHWSATLYQGSLSSSRKRNLTHEITQQDILDLWENQNGLCYWLGIPMSQENRGTRVLDKVSLERIDPTVGYIKENVVLATTFANLGKSNNSPEDFSLFLKLICPLAIEIAELSRGLNQDERFSKS